MSGKECQILVQNKKEMKKQGALCPTSLLETFPPRGHSRSQSRASAIFIIRQVDVFSALLKIFYDNSILAYTISRFGDNK